MRGIGSEFAAMGIIVLAVVIILHLAVDNHVRPHYRIDTWTNQSGDTIYIVGRNDISRYFEKLPTFKNKLLALRMLDSLSAGEYHPVKATQ